MIFERGMQQFEQFASIEGAVKFYEGHIRQMRLDSVQREAAQAEKIIEWAGKYAELAARYAEGIDGRAR